MKAHLANVSTTLAGGYDAAVKQRETGTLPHVASRSPPQRGHRGGEGSIHARIEREKAEGVKWFNLSPYAKPQLDDAKRNLDGKIRRLSSLDTSNLPKTEEAYEEAYRAVTTPGATKQQIDAAMSKVRGSAMPAAYIEILTRRSAWPRPNKPPCPFRRLIDSNLPMSSRTARRSRHTAETKNRAVDRSRQFLAIRRSRRASASSTTC